MKQVVILILVLMFSIPSLAGERERLELLVAEAMGLPKMVDDMVLESFREVIRLNPSLTQESVEASLEPLLFSARQEYLDAYIDAYSVYSTDELRTLLDFYRTDMGRWYLEKGIEYNDNVVGRLAEVSQSINDELLEYLSKCP